MQSIIFNCRDETHSWFQTLKPVECVSSSHSFFYHVAILDLMNWEGIDHALILF